jgi:transposase
MTGRAGRWITEQVGRCARSVNEVAKELGCDWHTVNDAVVTYGEAPVDHPRRFGTVEAVGLDEALMVRRGPWRRQEFSTQIVDVGHGQLLDVVPGRSATEPMAGLAERGQAWCDEVRFATLDLSGPYRNLFTMMTPRAIQVADPFHMVRLANAKLDECRRRVQNDTLGHRGRKADPLCRCRRLLTNAEERLDEGGRARLVGLLRAGSPRRRRHDVAGEGSRARALHPRRSRPRPRVGQSAEPRPPRPRLPRRGPLARAHPRSLAP